MSFGSAILSGDAAGLFFAAVFALMLFWGLQYARRLGASPDSPLVEGSEPGQRIKVVIAEKPDRMPIILGLIS
jgi:hypothetical protein